MAGDLRDRRRRPSLISERRDGDSRGIAMLQRRADRAYRAMRRGNTAPSYRCEAWGEARVEGSLWRLVPASHVNWLADSSRFVSLSTHPKSGAMGYTAGRGRSASPTRPQHSGPCCSRDRPSSPPAAAALSGAPPPRWSTDRRHVLQDSPERGGVIDVGGGDRRGQGQPTAKPSRSTSGPSGPALRSGDDTAELEPQGDDEIGAAEFTSGRGR
jgi:hypothetical protein